MTDKINTKDENVYNANDAFEINELASLNEDISPELIEQLQNKISADANNLNKKAPMENSDASLFEEVNTSSGNDKKQKSVPKVNIDQTLDDNFIKKYKAKLNKQSSDSVPENNTTQQEKKEQNSISQNSENSIDNAFTSIPVTPDLNKNIEELSAGKIIEKPIEKSQLTYNDSLDFLDNNVKYSKYVIYIDPENTDFIESLTVKERKNLINKLLREQDDIAITKNRLNIFQTVIKHIIISIITIAISIPVVYWTINASLEATINNHRRSQGIFKTLYKEKGKIKQKSNLY